MQGIERVNFFPVRHLSPAASYHLLRLCEKVKPECILIEGPSDGNLLIPELVREGVVLPAAILAYTTELPVDTLLYPFASYSPEYQAIRWGMEHGAEVSFIDLPSDVSLSISRWSSVKDEEETADAEEKRQEYIKLSHAVYHGTAASEHEQTYDDYWERNFEHNLNEDAYEKSLLLQSYEIRQILEPAEIECLPQSASRDLVREAYMKRKIADSAEKYRPEKIIVVTGAYHTKTLFAHTQAMTDEEMKLLPKRDAKLTLMPYSYYRLSSRSGYGAGNAAPAYYELMWKHMEQGNLGQLPHTYMTQLGRYIRQGGGYCSTANIIEAVRLAAGLAFLKGGSQPSLCDLHDAAVSCIGHGEFSETVTAFAAVDIGTAIGVLPEGISQTPIQEDMQRNLKKLRLEKYKSAVTQELVLDIRENRRVINRELALLDLERSVFLHRLAFLNIGFAEMEKQNQEDSTWKEVWRLTWTPEVEIQVVEAVLKGETIELASAFVLKERLEACTDIYDAAELLTASYICRLAGSVESAVLIFQGLATESANFPNAVKAAMSLSMLIQYGSIRQFDTAPFIPLLAQIFLRACFILPDAASCDDKAAHEIAASISMMHTISQENYERIDDEAWVKELKKLSFRDDKNPILSGLAFAVLLERNLVSDEECQKEVSRRLSPGIPADIGAGWFEGLSMRNRYALLSRIGLFQELDVYLSSLEDAEFLRSVVFMRRAFGSFEPKEKNGVAELLSEIWGFGNDTISILLQSPLEEAELEALQELDDFDFD